MVLENYERILRTIPLEPSETILLPIGIQKPGSTERYREVIIDKMCGIDEENVAKRKIRKNSALTTTVLFRRCIQEIPGLLPEKSDPYKFIPLEYVSKWMTQIDRDFLLIAIAILSGQTETEIRAYCEDCDELTIESISYQEMTIYDWPEDAPLEMYGELLEGYKDQNGNIHKDFTYEFPNGYKTEKILTEAKGNQGRMSTLLWASSITQLGTLEAIDSDIASKMSSKDRRLLNQLETPGIDLMYTIECDQCGREYERMVDLSGFFGNLKKKEKKSRK